MNAAMHAALPPQRAGSFASDAMLLLRYGLVARVPNRLKMIAVVVLAGALIFTGLMVNQQIPWHLALVRVLTIGISVSYFVAWNVLVAGALLLCSPSQARLVPRIRRRAIVLILVSWAVGVAMGTLSFGMLVDSYLHAAVACSLYTMSIAMMQTRSPIGIGLIFVTYACFISKQLSVMLMGVFSGASGVLIALAILPLLLWVFVRVMFPLSSEKAWRVQNRVESGERASREPLGESATIGFQARAAYAVSLKRAMQGKSAPAKLALHVIGARHHWSDLLWVPALVLLIAVPVRLWLELRPDPGLQEALGTVSALPFGMLVLVSQVMRAWMPAVRVRATMAEQGLYRLTPLTPGAAALNRVLALALLRSGLESWLLMSVSILCASWLLWTPVDMLAVQACACVMLLPLLAVPLFDYSSAYALGRLSRDAWVSVTCVIGLVMLYFWLGVPQHLEQSLTWATVLAVFALVLLLVRGRTMLMAPPAFPAERFET